MKLTGPFEINMEIGMTNGDQSAVITFGLGKGKSVSPEEVQEALKKAEARVQEELGDDWRLCTKREYFNSLMADITGTNVSFALPGSDDWDTEE